ncbi:MAG: hypothetical protein KAT38_07960 [Bacteroidales bacterium]|nr:hypothetical protein [Bacteroidales bacterium]
MKKISAYRFLFVITFSFLFVNTNAQETTSTIGIEQFLHYERLNKDVEKRNPNPYENNIGNPYLFRDYANGEIVTIDNFRYNGKMRYNIYDDEIEYLVNDDKFWVSNPWVLDFITIDSITFIYCSADRQNKDEGSYYILLVSGDCKLLLKKGVILNDPVVAKPYVEAKPAEFVGRRDFFYILLENQEPVKITSKQKLLELFPEKTKQMKNYLKKISLNKGKDLIKLVEWKNGRGE